MASPPSPDRPRLRRLKVVPHDQAGTKGIVLQDPLGIAEPIFVPAALVPLLARCDGTQTLRDLDRLATKLAPAMPMGFVAGLVADLDAAYALESPLLLARMESESARFLARGSRPARHPGSAGYPTDSAALRRALGQIVEPARPRTESTGVRREPSPRGLIAPHIDLARGAAGYRAAYAELRAGEPADLYVVFGTGHQGPSAPLTGLAIDWETPLGTIATDRAFVAAVHARVGKPAGHDLLLHRDEHSLEFQILLLRWVLQDRPFEVAAFLTGALPSSDHDPLTETYVQDLLHAVRAAAEQHGGRVCYVAGADLAHRGPWFGDLGIVTEPDLLDLDRRERARLRHLENGEPGRFFASIEALANPDRVCGTVPILLTAELAGGPAQLLHYGQATATDGSQVVSYCAARFG